MTRREMLALLSTAAVLPAREAPSAPVAVAPCQSYDEDLVAILGRMFDQLGGLGGLVRDKTVAVKLNMTGSPGLRFEGRPLGVTHYNHPKVLEALIHHLDRAGARRIRLTESFWGTPAPLEECMMDSGWSPRRLLAISRRVTFENTNAIGSYKRYARFPVPGGGLLFPAYDLNAALEETDVYVSFAKLKEHATCGVTLSLKNIFGSTPASIYGDDAGEDEPNEQPTKGRLKVMHEGARGPSKSAPQELDPGSPRSDGYRIPRVTADLAVARPIHLALIDGVESMGGGEGPWIPGVRYVKPGVLVAGMNPVTTDAVATAIMGFDPRADRGTPPFETCDNTMLLAEKLGAGTTDLQRIEVVGATIEQVRFPFRS
jgi:uncharacterized protein (DUF362 family)